MNWVNRFGIVPLLLIFALIGVLISLPAAVPLLFRRRYVRSIRAKRARVFSYALLSFMLGFVLSKWMDAVVADGTILYTYYPLEKEYSEEVSEAAVVSELLVRGMIPPPLRCSCYTERVVCRWADEAVTRWEHEQEYRWEHRQKFNSLGSERVPPPKKWNSWSKYLDSSFLLCFVSALVSGVLVWNLADRKLIQ